jgi:hypothetical protein
MKLPAGASYENILLCGTGSNCKLMNSSILSDGTLASIGEAVGAYGASLDLVNSTIAVNTNNENVTDAINANNECNINIQFSEIRITTINGVEGISAGLSIVKIVNSIVRTNSLNGDGGDGAFNVAIKGANLDIQNSEIAATSANGAPARGMDVEGKGIVIVKNSVVSGTSFGIYTRGGGIPFRIGISQLIGGHNGTAGVDKIVNCIDENFNQIQNL